ncbi:MAG: phosphate acyltransferase PlsX [Candidatus Omnitrophica bacterium]|nr:phosphate acyltransferase PlsX [Candidatus Omnitrophota bacterium]
MKIKIAIDGMGGDKAPYEIIKGVKTFAGKEKNSEIYLLGPSKEVSPLINKHPTENISFIDCPKYIPMDYKINLNLFREENTTMYRILKMVKEEKADIAYSAGNTATFVSLAVHLLGMIEGIERPAVCVNLPNQNGGITLFVDVGANITPKIIHLVQNAEMGSLYAREVFGISLPKTGLLNIGEEEAKGDELRQKTYQALKASEHINFIGNIEGHELYTGKADVVVTDGFSGNLILKVSEGITKSFKNMLLGEFKSSFTGKIGLLLTKNILKDFSRKSDYAEYGGGLLLGVNGNVIISHGRSSSKAVVSGLNLGQKIVAQSFLKKLKENTKKWPQKF